MRRIRISLTDEQADRIAAIAHDRRTTTSEVIRGILDDALGTGRPNDADRDAEDHRVLAATFATCADYPDWPGWLAGVRGPGADERLRQLGL